MDCLTNSVNITGFLVDTPASARASRIDAGPCSDPLKLNLGDLGYYRVQYDAKTQAELAKSIRQMSPSDRVNFLADTWASIEAGTGLTIGLHPASSVCPAGRKGSMAIGLQLKGSIRDAVSALKTKGVHFQGDVLNEGKAGSFIGFEDPDGNQLYLAELNWSHVEKGEGQYQPAKA